MNLKEKQIVILKSLPLEYAKNAFKTYKSGVAIRTSTGRIICDWREIEEMEEAGFIRFFRMQNLLIAQLTKKGRQEIDSYIALEKLVNSA
jgi:hypothetical protein